MGLGAVVMNACTPQVVREEPEPAPPPPPTPTPAITPRPAASAQERAIQLYPDLAVKNSLFNRTFLELVAQYKETNPRALTMVDWPITVAQQTAHMLGVTATTGLLPPPAATPVRVPAPVIVYVTPRPPGSLDKGAYNKARNVSGTPIFYP